MEDVKNAIEAKLEEKPLAECLQDLQKAVENTLKFFGKVDGNNLPLLLKGFKQLYDNSKLLDSIKKVVDAEYDRLCEHTIPQAFAELEIDSMSLHGRNFILSSRTHWTLNPENREGGLKWLRDNGLDAIIREDVNSKTLSSALRELLEIEAKTPPTDLIKLHTVEYIQVRKK